MLALAVLALTSSPTRAQSIAGAEIAPHGHFATETTFGADFPGTIIYNFGVYYSPAERFQIGVDGHTTVLTNALGLSGKLNLLRSADDAFLVSIQGTVRGFYMWTGNCNGESDLRIFCIESTASLILEPRLSAEWRPGIERRWGLFVEIASQHYYGNFDPDVLLGISDDDGSGWGHALRPAVGGHFQLSEAWAMSMRGGVWGSMREPRPVWTLGFTRVYR